jgi:hypothetical protein
MNPILGVFFHWLGGLASGSFYVPFRGVKRWSWETYWLVGGVFSWIIAPWVGAWVNTTDVPAVLAATSGQTLWWTYFFGALWGFGGLTFGLTMRYLGMSLGMAVALGYCAAFGTLIPPLYHGNFSHDLLEPTAGKVVLMGVIVCLAGIAVAGLAGKTKESEMSAEEKRNAVKEFDFKKGILVATFSGIMSACFAFGLDAGTSIKHRTLETDYINSAHAAGAKDVTFAAPVEAADVEKLLAALNAAPGEKAAKFEKLEDVLAVLDAPALARVKNHAASQADAKVVALPYYQLQPVTDLLDALNGMADSPLAKRLLAYNETLSQLARSLSGNAEKEQVLNVVLNQPTLQLKETSLAIDGAGVDFLAIHNKHSLWQNLPVLIVVLLGGFTTNFLWCLLLNLNNRTGYQYFTSTPREQSPLAMAVAAGGEGAAHPADAPLDGRADPTPAPLIANYFFAALAGVTWYFQFFFYSMGETQMGRFGFASWTLHMASIIIFSTLWGFYFHEWRGASSKARSLIFTGIATLIASTMIIGYGTWLKSQAPSEVKSESPGATATAK